jgi:hypothetical protein
MLRLFRKRNLLIAGMLVVGSATGLLGTTDTRAAFIGCRSDPIVVLSNGIVLDLSANIADDVSDIQSISYGLHVPTGVSLMRSVSTDGVVGYDEQFTVQPDSMLSGTAGIYTVEVQIQTGSANISATATIAAADADSLGITPGMVIPGAKSFAPVEANDKQKHGAKGPKLPAALPPTVISQVAAWAQTAAWAATASATDNIDQSLSATVTL